LAVPHEQTDWRRDVLEASIAHHARAAMASPCDATPTAPHQQTRLARQYVHEASLRDRVLCCAIAIVPVQRYLDMRHDAPSKPDRHARRARRRNCQDRVLR
jgi:hypothetical protein